MDRESVGGDAAEAAVNQVMSQHAQSFQLARLGSAALLSVWLMNAGAAPALNPCHVDLWPSQETSAEQQKNALEIARLQEQMQSLAATLRSEIAQIKDARVRARREAELKAILSRNETPLGLPLCQATSQTSRDYVQEVRLRIEDCGTNNFPKDNEQSLYGKVTINFLTDVNGQLVSSTLTERNDDPRINLHALRIVRASTPFGMVPPEMRDGGYEHFHYATRFNFVHTEDEGSGSSEPKMRCSLGKVGSSANQPTPVSPPSSSSAPASP